MAGELVAEIFRDQPSPAEPPVMPAQTWARLRFTEATGMVAEDISVELGVGAPAGAAGTRTWRRGGSVGGDAQIILSWLHGNALSDRVGVDTDMLVYLFIETAVQQRHHYCCDGEFLATLAGTGGYAGGTASAAWCLMLNLAPELVAAVLDAVADSGPRWRYAIVAARDPESPAGRVRQRLLADLDG